MIESYTLEAFGDCERNCFDLTKEEYNTFVEVLKVNRIKKVHEEIASLADILGSAKTKEIVRSILKDLKEEEEEYQEEE